MKTLGLVAVHGMGDTERHFADAFFERVRKKLPKKHRDRLEMDTVYYQDILQDNQEAYFQRARAKLDWIRLRRFVLFGFCDAASLESQKDGKTSPYFRAQSRILKTLKNMHRKLEKGSPIVIVAQSLGGQVVSNYLWDAQQERKPKVGIWSAPPSFSSKAEENTCRGLSVQRLYTTGCNIPVFVAGRDVDAIKPIKKPHSDFRWDNYFDEDDVLGWPLEELSPAYKGLVTDHVISAGLIANPTPFSHVKYWQDRDFLNPLVDDLKSLT